MIKVKKGLTPKIIQDLFKENPSRENPFQRPCVNYEIGKNALCVFGPIVWNTMLPEHIKKCKTYFQELGYIRVT